MPGGDIGIEETGSSAAAFLVPGGLIEGPGNVVAKIRVKCITQELEPGTGYAELIGVALFSNRPVFDLTTQDFWIS